MDRCCGRIHFPCSRLLHTTILLLALITPPSASERPNATGLRDVDGQAETARSILRYGDENRADYFRLLDIDGDHLIIGGADSVHNISVETFSDAQASDYKWEAGKEDREDCAMRTADKRFCRNYIRVLSKLSDGGLLLCGTNAFKPMCRVVDKPGSSQRQLNEFSGVGLAPYDPRYNNSFYVDARSGVLFAATVADFAGADALLFRKNVSSPDERGLRTQRHNTAFLNRPQFVGSIQTSDYVYFFFREEAADLHDGVGSAPTTYSRVARVCKNDRGGPPHYYEAEWTSFVKARLNCSIPERKPFYFDEIVSISEAVIGDDGRRLVYATFVSEFNFLRHSVICAFDVGEIDALFRSSDLLVTSSGGRPQWERRRRDEWTRRMGQCQSDSRILSGDEVTAMRRYPLMADAVPNAFPAGAVGIYRGEDQYSQIAVLSGVRTLEGSSTQVVYVATTRGNVIKMVNVAAGRADSPADTTTPVRRRHSEEEWGGDLSEDPFVQVAVFNVAKTPIRRLLIVKERYLVAVTDSVVYRLPLHQCASMSTCDECIGSRDPHCVWHHQSKCTFIGDNKSRTNLSHQDVFKKQKSDICAELAAKETTLPSTTPLTTAPTTTATSPHTLSTTGRHRHADVVPGPAVNPQCKCDDPSSGGKCPCNETTAVTRDTVAPLRNNAGQRGPTDDDWSLGSVPWWVWLIAALAVLQTLGCVLLSCKFYAARRRRHVKPGVAAPNKSTLYTKSTLETGNYASVPSYQSHGEIISAYGPVSCITNGSGHKGGARGSKLQHSQSVKEARRSWFFPFPNCGGDTKDTSISSSSSTNSTGNTSLTSSNGGAIQFRNGALGSLQNYDNGYARGASLPNGLNSFGKLHRVRVDGGDDVRIRLDGAMTPSGTLPRY